MGAPFLRNQFQLFFLFVLWRDEFPFRFKGRNGPLGGGTESENQEELEQDETCSSVDKQIFHTFTIIDPAAKNLNPGPTCALFKGFS